MAQEISNAYYYVPQDKDDLDIPNAFCIPVKQDDIRLAHIKKYFPLSGEYIFRFKYKYNNQIVWMDVPENSKKLPIFEGRIILKATRISWNSPSSNGNQNGSTINNNNATKPSSPSPVPAAQINQPSFQKPQQPSQPSQVLQQPQFQQQVSATPQKNTIDLFADDDFPNTSSTNNGNNSASSNMNNTNNITNLLDF